MVLQSALAVSPKLPVSRAAALLLPRMSGAGPLVASRPLVAALGSHRFSARAMPEYALTQSIIPILSVIGLCLFFSVPTAIKSLMPAVTEADIKARKLTRRVFTSLMLGVVVSLWIFSGTWGFLAVFAGMAAVAQLEYYRMALQNGIYPTWKLGTIGSLIMYAAAASHRPAVRDAIFPLTGTITIIYLLLRQERKTPPTTMSDVSTTFMGIYYFGYMPSFWIRLRALGPMAPGTLFSLFPRVSALAGPLVHRVTTSGADIFSVGALVQWWTMISIVAADVAAYFTGKRYGKTQLIKVSPKKTWEGFIGGCVAAMAVSATGASLMGWPLPLFTGGFYGLMCAVMALIGDLTVSLLKRSAQVKDTGSLLPGHGGLLDRLDSYLLVAAPAYFFVKVLLPLTVGWAS